jgi:hypothetical protein
MSLYYFAVPEGDADICVVFDGTLCGLNESLWSPNFFLPTSKNAAEMLSYSLCMTDVNFGEFFHNFFSDKRVRKHSSVDTTPLSPLLSTFRTGRDQIGEFKFIG